MTNPVDPKEYGYYFYPPEHPGNPGHPRLVVILREKPTGLHFDPSMVQFPVVGALHELEAAQVEHPWEGSSHYRVYPGRVNIFDLAGKEHEAFTFGGELQIEKGDHATTCSLTSPAPILALSTENATASFLTTEIEILLSKQRAKYGDDLERYETKLAQVEPVSLYLACLNALRKQFQHMPALNDSQTQRFVHFLTTESHAIHERDHIPEMHQSLDDLL